MDAATSSGGKNGGSDIAYSEVRVADLLKGAAIPTLAPLRKRPAETFVPQSPQSPDPRAPGPVPRPPLHPITGPSPPRAGGRLGGTPTQKMPEEEPGKKPPAGKALPALGEEAPRTALPRVRGLTNDCFTRLKCPSVPTLANAEEGWLRSFSSAVAELLETKVNAAGLSRHKFQNGDVYDGEWLDAMFHGRGAYCLNKNKGRYDGEWQQNARHGHGSIQYRSGAIYTGSWSNNKPDGKGTHRAKTGTEYQGEWLACRMHGQGQVTFAAGGKYVGQFRQDLYWGHGMLQFASGVVYDGGWARGKFHGAGILTDPTSGAKFSGNWKLGRREGQGTFKCAEYQYEGRWRRGKKHGHGRLVCPQFEYEGAFANDHEEGFGRWKGSNGDTYEGYFKAGDRHGRGTLAASDGTRYEGGWAFGQRHGDGVLHQRDGGTIHGTWERDRLVQGELLDGNGHRTQITADFQLAAKLDRLGSARGHALHAAPPALLLPGAVRKAPLAPLPGLRPTEDRASLVGDGRALPVQESPREPTSAGSPGLSSGGSLLPSPPPQRPPPAPSRLPRSPTTPAVPLAPPPAPSAPAHLSPRPPALAHPLGSLATGDMLRPRPPARSLAPAPAPSSELAIVKDSGPLTKPQGLHGLDAVLSPRGPLCPTAPSRS